MMTEEADTFTIAIHPVPFAGVSMEEQHKRAQALAEELFKIEELIKKKSKE
jgi:hypothetical protein